MDTHTRSFRPIAFFRDISILLYQVVLYGVLGHCSIISILYILYSIDIILRKTIKPLVHKIRLHGRRGKGMAEPFSRENEGKHRRRKVDKSCLTSLLRDPGWYVHKPDVQNEWDDNTQHSINKTQ